ncbi:ParB/RepB/Spo0J family partition protein [Mesorhizobium carmichaelinearum]|uniref:ParB/RepB/Spo0J family partition protein n=1 Tax=Mesorhizobium carmichaelinearum TaxID=1208188 RepID=UPI000BA40D77|nr:ParB N-terminal domain-containing protein [Mesorhizobium carmichaelinearum]
MDGNSTAAISEAATKDSSFEPARLLAELVSATEVEQQCVRPAELALDEITLMPELFQPREISEKHIADLARTIQNFGKVEPVTVLPVGPRAVLVDGHHRIEAYRRVGTVAGIPVQYFQGTPQEAVLEAGRANSQVKLPMASRERQDYAWRLVQLDQHSKAEIAKAAGVSVAQVGNMRAVGKRLGQDAFNYPSWWRAREAAEGPAEEMSEGDRQQWKEELAQRFADRLAKEFSTSMAKHPEVAAMALATYFGRKLPEVVAELRDFLPEDDEQSEF